MPVRVRVPTRIRTDGPALISRQGAIAEGVAAAVERALRNSRNVVVAPRGELVELALSDPEFSWQGDGVDDVDPDVRRALEEAVVGAISQATARARLRRESPATTWGTDDVAETVQTELYDEELGWYTLPSYDARTPRVQVPVQRHSRPAKGAAGVNLPGWRKLTPKEALQLFVAAVKQRGVPPGGFLGAIFNRTAGEGWADALTIVIVRFPDGKVMAVAQVGGLLAASAEASGAPEIKETSLAPSGSFRLRRFGKGGGAGANATVLEDYFRPIIRAKFRARRVEYATDEDYTKDIDRVALKPLVAKLAADIPPGATDFMELVHSGGSVLLPLHIPDEIDDDVELIPLGVSAGEEAGGAGAGAGAGAKGEGAKGEGAKGEGPKEAGELGGEEGAGKGAPGGVLPGEGDALAELVFPRAPAEADTITLECAPYEDEPSIRDLGEDGEAMRGLIQRIASRLDIDGTCEFAGQFLLNAATALGERAKAIAIWSGPAPATQAALGKDGNLGTLHFQPTASPQVVFFRHLAGTTPYISALFDMLHRVYPANKNKIGGHHAGEPYGWLVHFDHDLTVAMGLAVGDLFAMTCQVLFLQLLASSRDAIQKRLDTIDTYAANFEKYVLPQLQRIEELAKLREMILEQQRQDRIAAANMAMVQAYVPRTVAAPANSWNQARHQLTESLAPQPQAVAPSQGPAYQVIKDGDNYRIRDTKGKLWDLRSIENVTLLTRGSIESYEPLVKQFWDLPDIMERIRNPAIGLKAELTSILEEMKEHNKNIRTKAEASLDYGFRASKISEDIPSATVTGTSYHLGGIHRVAHEQIGEYFQGDRFYANGIDFLFGVELGRQELKAFITFTGLVLLAVLCPEAAILIGIVLAAEQLAEAEERKEIYQALINPDLVLSRAEVEAELFAAQLGLVLSFLPVFAELGAETRAALRAVARSGAEAAEAAAARAAAAEAAALMTRTIATGVIERFAIELGKAEVINKVISAALSPIIEARLHSRELTGPIGGLEGAMEALIRREQERRAEHPGTAGRGPAR